MEPAVRILDVCHQYGTKSVLNAINLDVFSGEILGLLGPSGAGKTTLINILTGQLKQTSGKAVLLGEDTRRISRSVYRKIGVMMEHFGLYDRLSCYENLKMFARIYRISCKEIDDVLKKVGLTEAGKTRASDLSKGMRSRLLLARALMAKPSVLFLDEPTSGLDPSTAERIHQLILQEKNRGNTIFLTTHNMVEAEKLCNHIALLHEGTIMEYGSPEDICRKYNHQRKIRLHLYDGRDLELENNCASAGEIGRYISEEIVETIHTTEPNLETVFMELTGRGFDKCW